MPQDPQPPNGQADDTSLLTWLGFRDPFEFGTARPLGALLGCLLTLIVPLLFFGALCAAGAVLWHSIHLALSGSKEGLNLGAGALIAALLGAPFVIWGTVLKHQSLRYQKEGHITDRISKAVEQLGAEKTVKVPKEDGSGSTERTLPNIEVRIGAILSLERIAQDSTKHDKGRDHVRVMEILCTYIRENAPAKGAVPGPYQIGVQWENSHDFPTSISPMDWLDDLPSIRLDIQVALDVLGRRSDPQISIEENFAAHDSKGYRLDLRRANLRRANLVGGKFKLALLQGTHLEGTILDGANFAGSNMTHAQLIGSQGADVNFKNACLDFCNFSNSLITTSNFDYADLRLTNFTQSTLSGSTFTFFRHYRGDLPDADFRDSIMDGVRIRGETMSLTFNQGLLNLQFLIRSSAFRQAILGGTIQTPDRIEKWLTFPEEALADTFGDASVTLADEAHRPAHWPRWVLPDTGPHSYEAEYQRWLADPQGYTPPPPPA